MPLAAASRLKSASQRSKLAGIAAIFLCKTRARRERDQRAASRQSNPSHCHHPLLPSPLSLPGIGTGRKPPAGTRHPGARQVVRSSLAGLAASRLSCLLVRGASRWPGADPGPVSGTTDFRQHDDGGPGSTTGGLTMRIRALMAATIGGLLWLEQPSPAAGPAAAARLRAPDQQRSGQGGRRRRRRRGEEEQLAHGHRGSRSGRLPGPFRARRRDPECLRFPGGGEGPHRRTVPPPQQGVRGPVRRRQHRLHELPRTTPGRSPRRAASRSSSTASSSARSGPAAAPASRTASRRPPAPMR